MKKFKLVNSSIKEEFEKEVEKYLNDGYEINGSVSKINDEFIINLIKNDSISVVNTEKFKFNTEIVNKIALDIENGRVYHGDSNPFYQNLIGYKKAHLVFNYTYEELENITKFNQNPFEFFNNCKILVEDNLLDLNLRDYQKEILNNFYTNQFSINMMSRQLGTTLINSLISLYEAIIRGTKVIIFCTSNLGRVEIIEKIENLYKNLEFYIKPGLLNNNKTSLKFDNGGEISAKMYNLHDITTADVYILYDFAFECNQSSFYKNIYPVAKSNSKIIINSSLKGNNFFYKLFQDAENNKNTFVPNKYYWFQVPRSKEWMNNIIEVIGEDSFDMEYNLRFY
jgi:hypothetical protein